MISSLRDAVRESLLLKGFIGIMMISFGVWGVGDFIGTGALDPGIVVKVGPTEISTLEFQRRFDQELNRFKEEVGSETARSDGVKRSIANALIQDIMQTATVNAAAQELGIVIPLQRLQSNLFKEPAFQNSVGTFDQGRFADALYQNKLTESQFLDMLTADLRRSTMISPVIANAGAPEYLVDNLFTYRNETRVADTLLVTAASLTDEDLPTGEELEALYEQNIHAYTAPEYRKVTALSIEAEHFHSADSITDADAKARYEETATRYRTPGTRHVYQLVFDTREQATSVRDQLEPNDDLAVLAAKASVPEPIDLGDFALGTPVANMMGDAYNLPISEVSQPVETDLGWHLFQISSETREEVIPFEDVKDEIRQSMLDESGMDAVYKASVDLEDAIAGGIPLREVSEFLGGKIVEITSMDRDGMDARGLEASNIFDRANFINAAFSTPEGQVSQLLDTPSRTGYYVIHVDSVTPPTPKPLEDVRLAVVTLWEKQARVSKAQKIAEKLMSHIGPASKYSELAARHNNVSYAPLGPITRFGEGLQSYHIVDSRRISPALLEKLFSAQAGDVISAPVVEGFVVARVKEIISPNAEGALLNAQMRLRATVVNAMREDLADQIVQAFATRYPAEINNEVIDQTLALR